MSKIISPLFYYLLLRPLSLLPLSILYLKGDFFCFLNWHIFGYRKKVVLQNLRNAFPDYSEKQIQQTGKAFYSHFFDLIIESLKAFSMSKENLMKRMVTLDSPVFKRFNPKEKNLILMTSHFGNWEWASMILGESAPWKPVGIYAPLSNPFFNKLIKQNRSRFGMNMIPVKEVSDFFRDEKTPFMCAFIGDQSPFKPQRAYWTQFLNQETAFMQGAERKAREFDMPVIYGHIRKKRRGYYEVEYHLIEESPRTAAQDSITEKYIRIAEKYIQAQPEFWLWSHRRWKHKREKFVRDSETAEALKEVQQ